MISEAPISRPALQSSRSFLREFAELILLVVCIYTAVNLATARAVIEGPSMEPTFYTGQLVIVSRAAFFYGPPTRGDVIVLHNPTNTSEDFIKRVIGLPGETVEIKGGRVYINGKKIEEPYIVQFCESGCDGSWTLTDSQYFVLGDNRPHSFDSHSFGPIAQSLIVGKAWIRYWPLPDATIFTHPNYGEIPKTAPIPPTATPILVPTFSDTGGGAPTT